MFYLYLALFKNNQHQLRDIINSTAKKRINLINQVLEAKLEVNYFHQLVKLYNQ